MIKRFFLCMKQGGCWWWGGLRGSQFMAVRAYIQRTPGQELHFCSQFTFKRADSERKGTREFLSTKKEKKTEKKGPQANSVF